MLSKAIKIAICAGVVALLGLAIALGAASVYLNGAAFRGQILGWVNARIKGRVDCKAHHLSLLSGRVTLSGVAVADPNGQPVATVEHFEVGIFWPALLGRALHITSLTIDRAEIALRHDAEDRLNLLLAVEPVTSATTAPDATQSSPWQARIDDLRLRQVKFSYERPTQGVVITTQQIETEGRGHLLGRAGQLRLAIGGLAVKAGEIDERLEQITVAASYDERAESPIAVEVNALDSTVALQGRIAKIAPVLEIKAVCDLDVSLDRLNPWLPQIKALTGRVKGQATLQGPWDDPQTTLRLTVSGGGAAGIVFENLSLEASLFQREIHLKDLNVQSPWADCKLAGRLDLRPVFPQRLSQATGDWNQAAYALQMQCGHLKLDQIPRLALPVQGTWQGQAHLDGVGFDPDQAQAKLAAALTAQGFKTAGATQSAAGQLAVEAQWERQILIVQALQASLGDTALQAQGRMDWKHKEAALHATLQSKALSALGECLDLPLPSGQIELKLDGQGPWREPTGQLALSGENLAMSGWRFGRLAAEAALDRKGRLTFSRLAVENGGGRLAGQGRIQLIRPGGQLQYDPKLSASFEATHLRLSDFTALSPVKLELNGRLAVQGTLLHPQANLTLANTQLQWQQVSCAIAGAARWDDGLLEVSKLHVSQGRSAVDLTAAAQWRQGPARSWSADPTVSARLKADAVRLEDFISGAVGTLTATADLQGRLSDLQGRFDLKGSDLGTRNQSLAAVALDGHLADNTLHLDQLAIILSPGQQVEGSGWYAFDQRFQADLHAANIELAQLEVLQQQDAISGWLDLNLQASGTVANPQLEGDLVIRSPAVNQQRFEDFRAAVRLQDHLLTALADLNFKVALSSRVDRGDFDLAVAFDQSDLSSFLSLALKGQWAARLSGEIKAAGNWHQLADIQAEAALGDGQLSYQQVQLISMDALTARLDKGYLRLPPARLQLMQAGYLEVAAKGNLQEQLDLSVEGRLPMAVLDPFSDAIERPKGQIHLQAKADGPWNQLRWRAEVSAADVGCLLTDLDQTVHDLNGRIHVTADQITVEKLAGRLDEGQFSLDGQVQLADGRPRQGDITFTATALPLQWPDAMDLKLSANLTLRGSPESATLDGRLVLLEGAYYKRFKYNLMSALAQPQRAQPVAAGWSAPEWMKAVALNVTIIHRYPFLVDNNVARLEIAPDLKVTGTAASPIMAGRAQINEGEVYFRGKTFTVQQGVVDFINPYKIEPDLDIVAQTKIRQWLIQLEVSGTPENLMIKLSSTPSESDADILSLILLGRTSSEVSEQKNGNETSTGEMLASLMTSVWGEEIKKSTGVDILEMQTKTPAEEGEDTTTQLTVGKQLTRRLTLKYALESGDEQTVQRAISEYRLLEHLIASGFQDSAGEHGGELMFRIEFR